jgi:hypothetical protein
MNDRSSGRLRVRSKNAGRQKLAELGIKPLALSAEESAAMWGSAERWFASAKPICSEPYGL